MNRFFKSAAHLTINLAIDAQTAQFLVLESLGVYQVYASTLECINKKANLFPVWCFKSVRVNRMDFFEQQENFREFLHALLDKDEEAMERSIGTAIDNAFGAFNEKDVEDAVMPSVH